MQLTRNGLPLKMITMGGLFVTNQPMILQTILGSCVSIILFDKNKKIGGMNHIMVPGSFVGVDIDKMMDERDNKYGIFSVEKLIYDMEALGSNRRDITARIYGASYMGNRNRIIDIQQSNVDFVKTFLEMTSIEVEEELILNDKALKIFFNTQTGNVEVVKV
ncbi:MAG: chemotaxis protein CheD [Spirochaetes bacterium]|nr:chemotaxis protein CheD [Spirochaetota bacterium]